MSVDTKSSIMSDKKCQQPSAAANRKQHHHSSSSLGEPKGVQQNFSNQPPTGNPNDIEQLRQELDCEKKNRSQIQCEYEDLKRQMAEFTAFVEESRSNPVSKYDTLIAKQDFFNDTLSKQISESKDKLKELSHSLKHAQTCGKECNIHMRDLIIDYHCISKDDQFIHHHHHLHSHANPSSSKDDDNHHRHHHHHHNRRPQHEPIVHPLHRHPLHRSQHHSSLAMPPNGIGNDDDDGLSLVRSAHRRDEGEACAPPLVDDDEDDGGGGTTNDLSKEIRRFQRMQIDLKSNLDRLQWRLDCESKIYHSVNDQYQKLQMDLYYLKNLNEKGASRETWMT